MGASARKLLMDNDPPASRPSRILVVEDEPLIRMNAVDALEEAGFIVVDAIHAAEALAHLQRDAADLLVICTDVHMPGTMDGIALAQHTHDNWPHIGLLVMSSKARPAPGELPQGAAFSPNPTFRERW